MPRIFLAFTVLVFQFFVAVIAKGQRISTIGELAALSTTYGTASLETSFNLSGTSMVEGISVKSHPGFEVSLTSGANFSSTVTVGSPGDIASTTVFVRLTSSTPAGSYSGNIELISSGAANVYVPIASGTVNKKDLFITIPTITPKEYDGNPASGAVIAGVITGFVGAETVTATATGEYDNANAGVSKTATVTYILSDGANGGLAANYSLANGTVTGNITPKVLIASIPTIANKVYDASPISGIVTPGKLSGFVGIETITATATGQYANSNAGVSKTATVTYLLSDGANGGLAANYNLANGTGTGNITHKVLAITIPTIASKVYNGNPISGTITVGIISGFVGIETVLASATGQYADANAGSGKTAIVTYTLSDGTNGGSAENYSLANGAGTGTITPKALIVTSPGIAAKVYDGSPTSGAVTVGVPSGLVSTETLLVAATGQYTDSNVGTGKIATVTYTLSNGTNGGLAANYSLASGTGIGNIVPKVLFVTSPVIATKVYDALSKSGAVTVGPVSGLVGNETLLVTAIGQYPDPNAGTGKIATVTYTLSNGTNGGLAANYSLAIGTITGNIVPKVLLITSPGIADKVYDASSVTGALTMGTITGFVGNETVTATVTGLYADPNAGNGKTATITYTLANGINGGLAINYSLMNEFKAGNVTPAPLKIVVLVDTVKCSGESITFDKTDYTVSGLVANEKIASVTLSPAGSPVNDPIGVGVHSRYIGANSPTALATPGPTVFMPANYNITVDSGKLTINKTPVLTQQKLTICSDLAFTITPANTNGNDFDIGTTYSWSAPAGTGFSGGSPGVDQATITGKLKNNTTGMITATYTVTPKTTVGIIVCTGQTFSLIVSIKPLPDIPTITALSSLQICQNSNQNFTAGIGSTNSNSDSVAYQWATDANLVASTPQSIPQTISLHKNAVISFPASGPYNLSVTVTVLEPIGCSNTGKITYSPAGVANAISNMIIYNGNDFVCLNNNVNNDIDGYQWGYDSKNLVPNNYSTTEAPFVTAQNLTRPISDTSTRYIWVLTKSGACFTKTYFNKPQGRPVVLPSTPVSQTQPIKIYPNPVTREAIITWRFAAPTDVMVLTITDLMGRKILSRSMATNLIPGRGVLNVAGLPKGMYLVNIIINNKYAAVGKFVKD